MTRSHDVSRSGTMGRGLLASLALSAAIGLASVAGGAELRFKSGATWRGELNDTVEVVYKQGGREQTVQGKVVRADSTMIVVEIESGGTVSKKSIFFGDVKSMKSVGGASTTDAAAGGTGPAAGDAAKTGTATGAGAGDATGVAKPAAAANNGFQGVFFITMEGMVGTGLRHDQIDAVGKEADKIGPGQIIVFEIDSPGGMMLEAEKIHASMNELKKRHRLVAWIKKAISAAAFTSMHCDEIYFMNIGSLGSMTMFSGHESVRGGETLEAWLALASETAKESGRDPHIARCMIVKDLVCSYDIPDGGGPKDARFRDDTKGRYLLDGPDTMLTFTASQALACGFSDGTADTTEELAKLMGLPEWKEVNDSGRKIYRDWQSLLKRGTDQMIQLWVSLNYKGDFLGEEDKVLAAKAAIIEDLIRWHERCEGCWYSAMAEKQVGIYPKEMLEEMLRDIRKRIGEIRAQRRDSGR